MFKNVTKQKLFHQLPNAEELDDAPDVPPTMMVTIIVVFSFLFVFFVAAVAYPIAQKLGESADDKVNLGMGNADRIGYIVSQKNILSTFKKVDDSTFQIPIQSAMQIIVNKQGDIFSSDSLK